MSAPSSQLNAIGPDEFQDFLLGTNFITKTPINVRAASIIVWFIAIRNERHLNENVGS